MSSNKNFELIEKEFNNETNGNYYRYEHKKTGAQVVLIENDDPNRVFLIGFRTPSNNSTGVAHILEHSTLCGSDKYPVKEPFVELLKGSLNTFLNAMTYPDKTVYPIASTNKKDFRNLTDVYLDAVFNPKIYDNPYTFMQEGWHYHLEDKEQPITYNGVVYNEMKGVFSDPTSILEYGIFKSLYPDTIYSKESGGDPEIIPDLSYEDFLNFHKTLYHPSNSYIYVYGDNDIEEQLEYLDSWLSNYDKEEVDSSIAIQEIPEDLVELTLDYAVAEDTPTENKDYIALNYAFPADLTPSDIRAIEVLVDYLLKDNSSILKKKLLDKKFAGDISVLFETSLQQPMFSIILKDSDKNRKDEFIETVSEVFDDIYKNGIKKEDLESVINISEFKLLEALNGEGISYPRGLMLGLSIFDNWLYDKNPLEKLKILNQFKYVNELKNNDQFTKILKKFFIDNNHKSLVIAEPNSNLNKEKEQKLLSKLEEYKNSLSDEELDNLVEKTLKLIENQSKEDSKEDLEKIPRLSIDEIDKEILKVNWELLNDSFPTVYVENKNSELTYLTLNFNILNISQEDLQYLKLFEELIAEVSTKNYNYADLSKAIDRYTGGINTGITINTNLETGEIIPRLVISVAFKNDNIDKTFELLKEILFNAFYTEKEIINDIVQSIKIQRKSIIQNQGNAIATIRMQANSSEAARFLEEIEGIEFYKFVSSLANNFDEKWDFLSKKLIKISQEVFNINSLTVSLACNSEIKDTILNKINNLEEFFSKEEFNQQNYNFKELSKREAFITPGNVMYNVKGGKVEFPEDINLGALRVLRTILVMDYLWNKVRVLGGAYGAGFTYNRNGLLSFTSFRDPNLAKTYQNYDEVVDYINNLDLNRNDLDKYIIGTIGNIDQPLSTKQILSLATDMYFNKLTNEQRQLERNQILNVSLKEILQNVDIIKDVLSQENYVTIGTETEINKNKSRFEEIDTIK